MEAVDRVGAGADVGLGGGPCGRPWGLTSIGFLGKKGEKGVASSRYLLR